LYEILRIKELYYDLRFTIYDLRLDLQLKTIQRLSGDFALTFFVLRFTYIGGQVLI
jgi:hypothetical protein